MLCVWMFHWSSASVVSSVFDLYSLWVHGHFITSRSIDIGMLCVFRLRGSRRQLRVVKLPLVVSRPLSRPPALPRRMGWRRAAPPAGVRSSGTLRVWTRSSLKQVSLCETCTRPEAPDGLESWHHSHNPLGMKEFILGFWLTAVVIRVRN